MQEHFKEEIEKGGSREGAAAKETRKSGVFTSTTRGQQSMSEKWPGIEIKEVMEKMQ